MKWKMQLRSREHSEPAFVRFENKTGRSIDVVWVNYTGKFIRYGVLEAGEFLDINTFKTHPWIFIDRKTGEKMKVDSGKVFYPRSCREIGQRLGINFPGHVRVPIPIILPLFTLRQLALHAIMKCLRSMSGIESLELPANLIYDLHKLNQTKENIMALYHFV